MASFDLPIAPLSSAAHTGTAATVELASDGTLDTDIPGLLLATSTHSASSALSVRFMRLTILPTVRGPTIVHSSVAQIAM